MKKTLLSSFLCLCTLFMGSTASAQCFRSTASGGATILQPSLIRTAWQDMAMTAAISSGHTFLSRLTAMNSCCDICLSEGMIVNDMRILGDYLYFCGYKESKGVIGRVAISQIQWGCGPALVEYRYLPANRASNLTRMTVYAEPHGNTVAAIGYRGDGLPRKYVAVSTYFADEGYVESNTFRYLDVCMTEALETLDDIIDYGLYIIIVGNDNRDNSFILHCCYKGSNFFNYFNDYYSFPYGPQELLSDHRICLLPGVLLGVASMGNDASSISQERTRFRQIDLINMVVRNDQEFSVAEKTVPKEIVYMENENLVILLQDMKLTEDDPEKSVFVNLNTLQNTDYVARGMYELSGTRYNCVERYDGSRYWASGGKHWMKKNLALEPYPEVCCGYEEIDVKMKEHVDGVPKSRNYHWNVDTFESQFEELPVNGDLIFDMCVE